jgi:hypothetical protein
MGGIMHRRGRRRGHPYVDVYLAEAVDSFLANEKKSIPPAKSVLCRQKMDWGGIIAL